MDTWDFLQPLWFHCKCHQPKKNPREQFRYGFSESFRFLSTLLYEVWPNSNFPLKIAPLWCTIFNRMNILSLHTCLLWIFDQKWGIWNSSTSNTDANCRFCRPVIFFDIFRNILVISFQIFLNIWWNFMKSDMLHMELNFKTARVRYNDVKYFLKESINHWNGIEIYYRWIIFFEFYHIFKCNMKYSAVYNNNEIGMK